MNRYIVILYLALLPCFGRLQAQVLWEISGNNTRAKSYLLATNRLVGYTFLDSIPNVFKCYGRCNKVITEFAIQDHEAIATLRKAAILPDSVKLSNFYTVEEYRAINDALQLSLGMGLDQLCRMKPSYLTELYRTELMRRWLQYDEKQSMETFFEQVAQESGKPVYGLDNLGETMYMLFDREPFHFQCEELKKIIDSPENEVRQERILTEMYRWGRLSDMTYTILSPDNHSTLSFSDYQVYCQRNNVWVKRLQSYLKDGRTFITLNAIYLGGDKGLISALRQSGYRVRPVNKRNNHLTK